MASEQQIFNVGVIGFGMAAKVFHIPLIATTPSFRLSAIVQRSPTPENSAPATYPSISHYTSAPQLFADPSIDIVIITTPPNTHFPLSLSALQAGKHVLVEKPFVPTSAEATQLIEATEKVNRLICVYQNRRWDADFLTFRKLQKEGKLGRIVDFESHFDRYKPVRPPTWKGELKMDDGGGVLYDLGTHLVDQIVLAFGLPESVSAEFKVERQDGASEPDAVEVKLRYPGGLTASAKANVMSIDTEQLRFWVRGTQGTWKKCHLDCQEDQLKAGLKPGDAGFGIEEEGKAGTLCVLEDGVPKKSVLRNVEPETYQKLYSGFAEAVKRGDESLVPVKATEARDVLRVLEAARKSVKEQRVVKMSEMA